MKSMSVVVLRPFFFVFLGFGGDFGKYLDVVGKVK
jgi:hypothetical protein